MRAAVSLLALFLLAAAGAGTAQNDPRPELLRLINAERQRAGAPPLRFSPALSGAAEEHAAQIAAQGRLQAGSSDEMWQRLRRAGYDAHSWTESLATSPGGPATVLRNLRRGNPDGFRQILAPEVRDLGLGVGRLRGSALYIFLAAVPQADYFARGTAGIRDLGRARAEVLARVNDARRQAGLASLRANARLDEAAQSHAEDMLARSYFAHESPEGKTVRERARAAGYDWRNIGENLAENQFAVDEVVDNWLRSPGHRRNILNPSFEEMGVGVALGRSGRRYRVLWTQAFGTRR